MGCLDPQISLFGPNDETFGGSPEVKGSPPTDKPELHDVLGHLCNSGPQQSPKTTPREPPWNSTPEAHEPAKLYYFFL